MTTEVATVPATMAVEDVAQFLLDHHISAAPVIDDDERVIGIVSEGDLIRRPETGTERHRAWWLVLLTAPEDSAAAYLKSHGHRAADVMTRNVVTVVEDASLGEVAATLEKRRIKRVPVVRGDRLVGIVSRADILRALAAARATTPRVPSDDDRSIRDRLLHEIAARGLRRRPYVNVVVSDGVVHLWGLANTDQERQALAQAAQEVKGVRSVENNLVIRAAPPPS